jgi:hypothetical protein
MTVMIGIDPHRATHTAVAIDWVGFAATATAEFFGCWSNATATTPS